jgi:maltooligosyltrehalose trehalohydrolase
MTRYQKLGAACSAVGADFLVWAPAHEEVKLHIIEPEDRVFPMNNHGDGYHGLTLEDVGANALYMYRLSNDLERPDPASNYQPRGVHGPSCLVDPNFHWTDSSWPGKDLEEYIIYELHVGTFTPEGTFDHAAKRMPQLRDLGITAIELMPVCQFPGARNWGYDGVFPFSAHHDYGGPDGLKRFVDKCHSLEMAVIIDVVYNHLGPEGNYLHDFGPYFTNKYGTPWGEAINFDSAFSDDVRRYFIENALMWIADYHMDALRLDAVHGIFDFSAKHILEEIGDEVHLLASRLNRKAYVIPESDLNDSRLIRTRPEGGYDLDAQWNDDFHHSVHALLTGERRGYYQDFGGIADLAKAFNSGFVYSGERSEYRKRKHGNRSSDLPARKFLVFSQNHDQVGNRVDSERLGSIVDPEAQKMAAGLVLLSPFIPLLFMGEEYGETAPFPYFVSHTDPDLVQAVREGRKREFQAFEWSGEPMDPQSEETFEAAKLNWEMRDRSNHLELLSFYQELIALRYKLGKIFGLDRERMEVIGWEDQGVLSVRRWNEKDHLLWVCAFKGPAKDLILPAPRAKGWIKVMDSMDPRWLGPGVATANEISDPGSICSEMTKNSFLVFLKRSEK